MTKLLFVVLLALAAAPFAASGAGCDTHQIRGTYSTSCQGFIIPQPGVLVPLAAIGVQSSDSDGKFNGTGHVSVGGQQMEERFENGTPELNDDCSGTITYNITLVTPQGDVPQPNQTFAFVVLDHGDRIRSIDVDEGQTASCLLERISTAPVR